MSIEKPDIARAAVMERDGRSVGASKPVKQSPRGMLRGSRRPPASRRRGKARIGAVDSSISVIIPAYRASRSSAAPSGSMLGQTCPPAEIVIESDDGADHAALLRAYGLSRRFDALG